MLLLLLSGHHLLLLRGELLGRRTGVLEGLGLWLRLLGRREELEYATYRLTDTLELVVDLDNVRVGLGALGFVIGEAGFVASDIAVRYIRRRAREKSGEERSAYDQERAERKGA
jgi:hypothetical protein